MEALCDRVVEGLIPTEPADDVVVLAARLAPVPERLSDSWPADPQVLVTIRQHLRRWLRAQGASEEETNDIVVATQEACTNAVEHAYRPGDESFRVEATCTAGRVRITVSDQGQWRPPRGTYGGRGLGMMRQLMEVDVRHGSTGTVVVLERTLERSPR
jgi:anti-sigma regulatory factor (Ser/Thr protein kinase)